MGGHGNSVAIPSLPVGAGTVVDTFYREAGLLPRYEALRWTLEECERLPWCYRCHLAECIVIVSRSR